MCNMVMGFTTLGLFFPPRVWSWDAWDLWTLARAETYNLTTFPMDGKIDGWTYKHSNA